MGKDAAVANSETATSTLREQHVRRVVDAAQESHSAITRRNYLAAWALAGASSPCDPISLRIRIPFGRKPRVHLPVAFAACLQHRPDLPAADPRRSVPVFGPRFPGCRRSDIRGLPSLARSAYTLERATLHVSHTIVSGYDRFVAGLTRPTASGISSARPRTPIFPAAPPATRPRIVISPSSARVRSRSPSRPVLPLQPLLAPFQELPPQPLQLRRRNPNLQAHLADVLAPAAAATPPRPAAVRSTAFGRPSRLPRLLAESCSSVLPDIPCLLSPGLRKRCQLPSKNIGEHYTSPLLAATRLGPKQASRVRGASFGCASCHRADLAASTGLFCRLARG